MDDANVSMEKAKGTTRGCDLWAREARPEIWQLAYGQYEGQKHIQAFSQARWQLWGELDEYVKKAWNTKGELAREKVKGNLRQTEPPQLSYR